MSDWKSSIPEADGWYWFKPEGGTASPYRLTGGRLLIVCSNDNFSISASMFAGLWNHKAIKVPK
jgi:hypothetical protein